MDNFVNDIQNTPKKDRVAAILARLNEDFSSDGREAALCRLDEISSIGAKWSRMIEKLTSVPPGGISNDLREVLYEAFQLKIQQEIVLRAKDTGILPNEIDRVLDFLESCRQIKGGCHLKVSFQTPHAYVYGLCAIAAWAGQNARSIEFSSTTSRVAHFLQRAGVIDALKDPSSDPVRFDTENILGFTRISPGKSFDTDTHAGRLVDLFRKHTDLTQSSARALAISFAELIENAIKHGKIKSPAWLFANYHPLPRIMHVCICDRGIGIQQSFLDSDNLECRSLAQHETEWVRAATNPLVTSKTSEHAGYGLYLVRELCRCNGGIFLVISGRASYRLSALSEPQGVEYVSKRDGPWHGTLVAM